MNKINNEISSRTTIFQYTRFFHIINAFFSTQSVLLNFFMNWASNVAYVFFNTYNHHTETHFINSIFGSMSRPRSICVVSFWSIFHFQPHFHCRQSYNVIKTEAPIFCTFLGISPIIFGWQRRWRKWIIFN